MSAWKPWRMFLVCLTATAIGVAGAGCSSDDDDEGSAAAGGSASAGSGSSQSGNSGANPPAPANPGDNNQPPADPGRLTVPDALDPADGDREGSPGATLTVTFRWSAVQNATGYTIVVIDAGGKQRTKSSSSTSTTMELPLGDYRWYVYATAGGQEGFPSPENSFLIYAIV